MMCQRLLVINRIFFMILISRISTHTHTQNHASSFLTFNKGIQVLYSFIYYQSYRYHTGRVIADLDLKTGAMFLIAQCF